MPGLRRAMIWASVALWVSPAASAPWLDASPREELARWLDGGDAILVVIVLPGLRADALEAERRDGTPLMPALTALAERSIRYPDAMTGAPHPAAGPFELLAGVEGRRYLTRSVSAAPWSGGFTRLVEKGYRPLVAGAPPDDVLSGAFPWLLEDPAVDLEDFLARLSAAASQPGPHLALFFSSASLPPLQLEDTQLDATDPEPWADAPPHATMEQVVERRRATARSMARVLRVGQALGTRRHAETLAWVAEAAAAGADHTVARVMEALETSGSFPRASVVVTSTLGTAVGERDVVGVASGVSWEHVTVPLVWQLPFGDPASRRDFPAQLQDVASTLVDLLDRRGPETGADLLGEAPVDRARLSLAWYERAGERRSGFRLTTPALTLHVDSHGDLGLYDRRWDPRELDDLARRQPALVETAQAQLRARLWGASPQLWILVKGDAGDLVSGVVTGRGLAGARGDRLEPMDALQTADDRVTFSLVADEADVLAIPLPPDFEAVAVELQSPRRQSPLFLGLRAIPWPERSVRLGPFQPASLGAWVGVEAPDPQAWLADRPPGVVVWLAGG